MKTIVRFGAAVALTAMLAIGFAGPASADTLGSVELHVRACPADAVDVFADCHDNPVAGYEFDNYQIDSCTSDEAGNCSLVNDNEDYAEIAYDPADFFAIYCTSDDDAVEATVRDEDVYIGWVDAVDALVVCDFYMMDDSLPLAHAGGAALPDTGAGVNGQGANLGLLLAGVVALGGLAVASRRAAVR